MNGVWSPLRLRERQWATIVPDQATLSVFTKAVVKVLALAWDE
jgi:hypothetical protein